MTIPEVTVEVGFGSGYSTALDDVTWTDVTDALEAQHGLTITRGRADEFSDVQPSTLTLVLDNSTGDFTPGNTAGDNYPDVRLGTPIRVSCDWDGTTYRRFTGYVVDWPVSWPDPSAGQSLATVTATSRMARLGRNDRTYALAEQLGPDGPAMWYPLSEPKDSKHAFNYAASPQGRMSIAHADEGTVEFGVDDGAPFDERTAVSIAPTVSPGGPGLTAKVVTQPASSETAIAIECWLSTTSSATAADVVTLYSNRLVGIGLALGTAVISYTDSGTPTRQFTGVTVNDGDPHHVAVILGLDGSGDMSITPVIDGVEITGISDVTVGYNTFSDFQSLNVGFRAPDDPGNPADVTVGQVAVYGGSSVPSVADFQAHYKAGLDGFEGDSSDERVERILAWAGLDTSVDVDTEDGSTTSMSGVRIEGQSTLQAILDVAKTENGVVFDGGDGVVYLHSRAHRYNATAAVTLSCDEQEVEASLLPKMDDQQQCNRITVSLPSGYTASAEDTDSIDAYGTYGETRTLLSTLEDEADSAADYRVLKYAEPLTRVPNCAAQLAALDTATVTAILATELGDLITLDDLPDQAPASSMDFFVEGYTETVGVESWTWTANLSPGDVPGDVFTLGSSDLGSETILGY